MAAGYYGVNELTATMQGVHVGGVAHPGAASPCGEVPGQPGVVIYPHMGAGMGMPFFSTDTVAVQRALESRCDAVFFANADALRVSPRRSRPFS